MSPKRCGNWSDEEIRLPRSEAIESGGAALENVCVGAARVPRERVECRKDGDVACRKNGSKKPKRFGDGLGLLIESNNEKRGAAKLCGKISGQESFRDWLQASELNERLARTQCRECAIHWGGAQQAFQTFANDR